MIHFCAAMMNLHRRNSSRKVLGFITVLASVFFIFDMVQGGAVRASFHRASGQLISAVRVFLPSFSSFETRAHLQEENRQLQERVLLLEAQYLSTKTGQTLTGSNTASSTLRKARILSLPSTSPYGTFLSIVPSDVSRGTVVGFGGVALGTIESIQKNTALVRTFFAPDTEIQTVVHGVPVILRGFGGANAKGKAPRGSAIEIEDSVVSPESQWRPIGVVSAVEDASSDSSVSIIVRPALNLDELTELELYEMP